MTRQTTPKIKQSGRALIGLGLVLLVGGLGLMVTAFTPNYDYSSFAINWPTAFLSAVAIQGALMVMIMGAIFYTSAAAQTPAE